MRRLVFAACVLACAVICRPAHAQSSCTVSGTGVAFGLYAPLSGAGVTTTGTITVTCNPGTVSVLVSYTIALSIGGGASFALRSMGGPSPRLRYQLYRDAAYSQVWGDGSAGTYVVTDGYLLGVVLPITKTYTIFGSIAANAAAGQGSYTDPIVLTLSY